MKKILEFCLRILDYIWPNPGLQMMKMRRDSFQRSLDLSLRIFHEQRRLEMRCSTPQKMTDDTLYGRRYMMDEDL